MEIKTVGVVGCGLMGHGIAQVAAQAGYGVVVREIDRGALDKGLGRIDRQLARAVDRGKLEQADADAARGRCDVLFDEFRERRFARPPTLRKMLSAGWYGRKSGRGFYDYSGDAPVAVELR
jgi:3-hydroxyacyl-CoA dehydrogenase